MLDHRLREKKSSWILLATAIAVPIVSLAACNQLVMLRLLRVAKCIGQDDSGDRIDGKSANPQIPTFQTR